MSNKKFGLIMENWKKFLNEEAEGVAPDPAVAQKVGSVINLPYEQFVTQFASIAADPKVQAVLNYGLKDGNPSDEKVKITQINAKVSVLKPTQNEIAMDKSLAFPLKDANTFNTYKKGGVVAPGGKKIVTAEGGKYIIDGHHRWSQVFCVNPDTEIQAIDITIPGADPMTYLKVTQLAIAADIQKIPTASAKGSANLLTVDAETLKGYIQQNAAPPVVQSMGGLEQLQSLIVANSEKMKKGNQPVAGAPKRDVMPQTDDATGWAAKAGSGQINFKDTANVGSGAAAPQAQMKESEIRSIIRNEILKEFKNKNKKQ